jgi:uncharacterized protein RhaS with RHS repeats
MQQRYYDTFAGRLLDVDPIVTDAHTGTSFNRYAYANNSPYRYVDPDGRTPLDVGFLLWDIGKLGGALYSGVGVGPALIDVAISTAGVFSPVPGAGQVYKAVRIAEVSRTVEHTARGASAVTRTATQIASEGGKHAGQLQQFLKQTPEQLNKTINSFDKQISKHEGRLADPASKVANFDSLRPEHQRNLLHHWQQDIARHRELKSIAQDVLKDVVQ